MQNAFGLELKINSRFSLGLDYTVRRNSDVLPGTRNSPSIHGGTVRGSGGFPSITSSKAFSSPNRYSSGPPTT